MSYISAVDHLYALGHELAAATPTQPRRKFDLAHMRALVAALGDPQKTFPSVLIAGTNGKGSTAATLSSILTAAGYRTGLYTSPHLIRVNERIQIDGAAIPDEVFGRLYFQVDNAANRLVADATLPHHPSFFEVLTAIAFLYFAGPTETRVPHSSQSHRDEWETSTSANPTPRVPHSSQSHRDEWETSTSADPTPRVPHSSQSHRDEWETSTSANPIPRVPHSSQSHRDGWETSTSPVEIAILEVGLGGRLDATNIVDPLLSIITDIALDHQEYLGNTISAITREKAGILRPNGTLITLPQHPEANQAIGEAAATLNLTAISAASFIPPTTPAAPQKKHVISTEAQRSGETPFFLSDPPQNRVPHLRDSLTVAKVGGTTTELFPPNHYTLTLDNEPLEIDSPLQGQHQQRNIALAITAAIALRNQISYNIHPASNQKGYNIPNSAIEAGIRNTKWPGRLEFIPSTPPILLDVAHNPAGAWTLRAAIAQLPEAQPRTLIFSCLRDKSLKEMTQILLPLFDSTSGEPGRVRDHVILAPIDNPRAASVEDLLAAAHALDIPAHAAPHLTAALAQARAITPKDGLIIATGSVYLVGEIRNLALIGGETSE